MDQPENFTLTLNFGGVQYSTATHVSDAEWAMPDDEFIKRIVVPMVTDSRRRITEKVSEKAASEMRSYADKLREWKWVARSVLELETTPPGSYILVDEEQSLPIKESRNGYLIAEDRFAEGVWQKVALISRPQSGGKLQLPVGCEYATFRPDGCRVIIDWMLVAEHGDLSDHYMTNRHNG